MSKQKIQEPVFPLYFSIILNEAFNVTKLELQGYPSIYRFFSGQKSWNEPFDWRGVKNSTIQSNTRAGSNQCFQSFFLWF